MAKGDALAKEAAADACLSRPTRTGIAGSSQGTTRRRAAAAASDSPADPRHGRSDPQRDEEARRVAATGSRRSTQVCGQRPRRPAQREARQLGISTVSITWMTPFDWNTFWMVTREALPLLSQMVSVLALELDT